MTDSSMHEAALAAAHRLLAEALKVSETGYQPSLLLGLETTVTLVVAMVVATTRCPDKRQAATEYMHVLTEQALVRVQELYK